MFEQVRNGGGIQERVFTAVGRARYQHTVNRQREQEESKCSSSRDRGRSQSPAVHKESVETHGAYSSSARKVGQEDQEFRVTLKTQPRLNETQYQKTKKETMSPGLDKGTCCELGDLCLMGP